jgi:hypothetical protein
MNYSIPFVLPSLGKLYGDAIPNGEVVLKPIRGEQEELLAATEEGEENTLPILQHITQQLTVFPNKFAIVDLLLTDWLAVMINIFAESYSPQITVTPKCPRCPRQEPHTVNFSAMQYTTADEIEEYKEPFEVTLPRSGEKVLLQYLRVRNINATIEYKKDKKIPDHQKKPLSYATAQQIMMIDGVSSTPIKTTMWVKRALGFDLRHLRGEIAKRDTGYDPRLPIKCACGHEFHTKLPLDFFRAGASGS